MNFSFKNQFFILSVCVCVWVPWMSACSRLSTEEMQLSPLRRLVIYIFLPMHSGVCVCFWVHVCHLYLCQPRQFKMSLEYSVYAGIQCSNYLCNVRVVYRFPPEIPKKLFAFYPPFAGFRKSILSLFVNCLCCRCVGQLSVCVTLAMHAQLYDTRWVGLLHFREMSMVWNMRFDRIEHTGLLLFVVWLAFACQCWRCQRENTIAPSVSAGRANQTVFLIVKIFIECS